MHCAYLSLMVNCELIKSQMFENVVAKFCDSLKYRFQYKDELS
jgi:hypothetical protein